MSRVTVPKIDTRQASDLLRQLRALAPHFTREWPARDDADPGVGLLKIFSSIAEGVISRLNRAPDRNFLAFLDMLGIRLLPKTPAHAPVRFLVASGTEAPFLVARKTQVTAGATADHPELPFETIEDLWAIPAALVSLISVDPERDRIYKPPPTFLSLELAANELPPLIVQAFSASGSQVLQLEPPGQVEEGDFLRIEQSPAQSRQSGDCLPMISGSQSQVSDHLIVSAVKGNIVTVTEPLARDYAEGTRVSKVTHFELFEGKNFQEHILYLAHADYFAIKSEAQIELRVEHAGPLSRLLPLNLAWEFFGVTDVPKTEDGWHPLAVEADGTVGLSRPGRVLLRKPAGEIKELEINGTKNRWIRARLRDSLPALPPPSLPRVESVSLIVSSGAALQPDQAFNNDTPLTTTVSFNPFGPEPRLFDRFYVASEEAFSKPGAEVTLDVQLDFTDLLASPAAIFRAGLIRAFAHGAGGKLVEFQIDPVTSKHEVVSHRAPVDRRLLTGSLPAVVENGLQTIVGVVSRADDGTVHLRYIPSNNDSSWQWLDLSTGLQGELAFDPAAVSFVDAWRIYVVADKRVQARLVSAVDPNIPTAWAELTSQGNDPRPIVASTPFSRVVRVGETFQFWVLVTDEGGRTWLHNGLTWKDITPSEAFLAQKNARPFAVQEGDAVIRVYLRSATDELVSFTNEAGGNPINLNAPDGVKVDSNPFVFPPDRGTRAFVRGSNDQLWERDLNLGDWQSHENSLDVVLAGDPFVVGYSLGNDNGDILSVLSTSNKNSLLEFRSRLSDIESGVLVAGPAQILMLEDRLGNLAEPFIHITLGTGSDSSGDAVRKVSGGDPRGKLKIAILEEPFDEVPDATTVYEVLGRVETGNVAADSESEDEDDITLKTGTVANVGDFVYLNKVDAEGQLRVIIDIAEDGVTATVDFPWNPTATPKVGDEYFIFVLNDSGLEAQLGSASRVVLESGLTTKPHAGLFIEVDTGDDQSVTAEIRSFTPSFRMLEVVGEFSSPPQAGGNYRITVGNVDEGWQAYRDPDQTELRPDLSWEYWNGRGWVALKVDDGTDDFLVPGEVKFTLPEDLAKTEVVGQENFWIRSRIVGGDYGRELFEVEKDGRLTIKKDPIRPPLIKALNITYSLVERKFPQFCVTLNNLIYLNQTAANVTADKYFLPYQPLKDSNKALYLGFDRSFESGPVRIYFAAKELPVDDQNKPKLNWEFAFENKWGKLFAEDRTEAFTRSDSVGLTVPIGFQNSQQFGSALFWIRATLLEGVWSQSPLLSGVFLNTVETIQARTILNEILGSSSATRNQHFKFQQLPVLEGEEIRVRESLTEQELNELITARGEDAVLAIRDQQDRVMETWIKWQEVQEFFDSGPDSRDYRLDRASGDLEFGDNIHGRIPPAGGDNIVAFAYQAGGGIAGNVAAGEIKSPVTAVAGVDSVINPLPAGAGSEAATPEDMLEIGPAQISNRGRAVTSDDFERLALEASREVAKARCLANRNAGGRNEIGWTSIYLVPHSKDKTPQPSLELRRSVSRYLSGRADLTLIDEDHLFIGPPEYVPVNVDVTVFAKSLDSVALAELNVRKKLEAFLHPLTGGFEGTGWDFGRDLAASDIYRLLEDIDEVDHIEKLRLSTSNAETVAVGNDALVASGTHIIRMNVAK